jgi:hypothetical protein
MSVYRILSNSSYINDCYTPLHVVLSCRQIHKPQHIKGMIGTTVYRSFLKAERLTVPRTANCFSVALRELYGTSQWSACVQALEAQWQETPSSSLFNHLTPELNPSAQRCLTRFFTWYFASWTVHFVNICVKNQQMQQLFIQFINYVWYLLHVSALHCHLQGAYAPRH